jgi:AAA domain-containing protein
MDFREILIKNVKTMFPLASFVLDFQNLVEGLKPGVYADIVPVTGATIDNIVNVVVDRAINDGWITGIVDRLPRNPATEAEIDFIIGVIKEAPQPTAADPFDEVLLEGNRPFANREDLRLSLRELCGATGPTLLIVTGNPGTGKSFSFYLAQHMVRQKGFITSLFDVGVFADPVALATEILRRIGLPLQNKATGLESKERSVGQELADQIKDAIEERRQRRLFVFDGFPLPGEAPLPAETTALIVRLAKYADEELRPFLRIALIRFSGTLPEAIDDVAERDEAQPFTDAHMLSTLQQIVRARGWRISDQALETEIAGVAGKTLRERFLFMRKMIRTLSRPPAAPGGQP